MPAASTDSLALYFEPKLPPVLGKMKKIAIGAHRLHILTSLQKIALAKISCCPHIRQLWSRVKLQTNGALQEWSLQVMYQESYSADQGGRAGFHDQRATAVPLTVVVA